MFLVDDFKLKRQYSSMET